MLKPITNCRACGSALLTEFLDLGEQYISDFREDDSKPPRYPLVAVLCGDCYLVQLKHSVPQSEMYHENYGFKSGISDSIKADLDEIVTEAFQWKPDPKNWLDIASNDGSLLRCVPDDIYRVGIDPVKFLCEQAEPYADEIINDYYSLEAVRWFKLFDVITSISCFYDMPDPEQFVDDVKVKLSKRGVWIIQQNYLLTTLELGAVDNFCHEHLEYYTLLSLEKLLDRRGLEVIDVSTSMVNGGSIRTVVAHKGVFEVSESVQRQRTIESDAKISELSTYLDFAEQARLNLIQLGSLVEFLDQNHERIFILGASTRGSTIWQSADIVHAEYAVERNPAKVGKYFSALGIPIISEEESRHLKPDYMIVGPWFFSAEIIDREAEYLDNGGKLIIPLPKLEVIDGN